MLRDAGLDTSVADMIRRNFYGVILASFKNE